MRRTSEKSQKACMAQGIRLLLIWGILGEKGNTLFPWASFPTLSQSPAMCEEVEQDTLKGPKGPVSLLSSLLIRMFHKKLFPLEMHPSPHFHPPKNLCMTLSYSFLSPIQLLPLS